MYQMYDYNPDNHQGILDLTNEQLAEMLEKEADALIQHVPHEIAHILTYREAAKRLRNG